MKKINKTKKEGILHRNFHVWGGKLPSEKVNVSVNIKSAFSCLKKEKKVVVFVVLSWHTHTQVIAFVCESNHAIHKLNKTPIASNFLLDETL